MVPGARRGGAGGPGKPRRGSGRSVGGVCLFVGFGDRMLLCVSVPAITRAHSRSLIVVVAATFALCYVFLLH